MLNITAKYTGWQRLFGFQAGIFRVRVKNKTPCDLRYEVGLKKTTVPGLLCRENCVILTMSSTIHIVPACDRQH